MYFFEKNIVYVKYNADINNTAGDINPILDTHTQYPYPNTQFFWVLYPIPIIYLLIFIINFGVVN